MQINYAVSSCLWACFLNRILLFWNQTFTCVSVNLSEAASRRLSSPATYCCLENVLSNCSNCTGVKMVRDLLFGLPFSFLPASFLSRSKFRTKMCKSQITSNEPIWSVVVTDLGSFLLEKVLSIVWLCCPNTGLYFNPQNKCFSERPKRGT